MEVILPLETPLIKLLYIIIYWKYTWWQYKLLQNRFQSLNLNTILDIIQTFRICLLFTINCLVRFMWIWILLKIMRIMKYINIKGAFDSQYHNYVLIRVLVILSIIFVNMYCWNKLQFSIRVLYHYTCFIIINKWCWYCYYFYIN